MLLKSSPSQKLHNLFQYKSDNFSTDKSWWIKEALSSQLLAVRTSQICASASGGGDLPGPPARRAPQQPGSMGSSDCSGNGHRETHCPSSGLAHHLCTYLGKAGAEKCLPGTDHVSNISWESSGSAPVPQPAFLGADLGQYWLLVRVNFSKLHLSFVIT